ncbi:MAG: hypothetical protein WC971_09255 [Coriobacteriia bacterium]
MRRTGTLFAVGALIVAATAWGLTVSVGRSSEVLRRSELPDIGFDRTVGSARTAVRARWGDAADEVGISYDGETVGPYSFGIDDRDRVYVLDQINRRVVRYRDGAVEATFSLPGVWCEDIAVSRDRFAVLYRTRTERSILLFDADDGQVATLTIDPSAPDPYRVRIIEDEVCIESHDIRGAGFYVIGKLDGSTVASETQRTMKQDGFPTPTGDAITGGVIDENDVRIDVESRDGAPKTRIRMFSKRRFSGIPEVSGDLRGNVYVAYGLYWENPKDINDRKGRLVIAKYASDGELVGRVETENDWYAEPIRKVVVTPSGEIYHLASDRNGIRILHWTHGR